MTTAKKSDEEDGNRRPEQDLDRRYGRIAISALVAALPYCSETTNQGSASSETRKHRAA